LGAVAADESSAPDGQALDPRYVLEQRLVGRLGAVAVAAALLVCLVIAFIDADELTSVGRAALILLSLAAVAGLAWHAERWPALEYAHTRYRLDAGGLRIWRGVYWRSVTHVPRSRVQHTDVSQGPIERQYGLGTLVVYTAGTDHARVMLPGLAHEVAMRVRDDLRVDPTDDIL
jgi:membrane protein YdbS with pleckstrin-like domain